MSEARGEPQPRHSVWSLPALRQLAVVMCLGYTSFFLTLAALPVWAAAGGVSAGAVGLVTTVMLAVTILFQGLVPAAVARFGVTRSLSIGLLLLGAPAPLYMIDQSLWWLSSVSAVRGIGFAVLTVLGATMIARTAPVAQRGAALGAVGFAIAIANLVAVPAGVALTLAGEFPWVAALACIPVLAVRLVPKLVASLLEGHRYADRPGGSLRAAAAVAGPSIILLSVTLAAAGLVTFLPIDRPDGVLATLSILVFGITGALARWRSGGLADRFGVTRLLTPAIICASAGMLLVAVALVWQPVEGILAYMAVIAGAAVFGIGYGAVQCLTLLIAFARASNDSVASSVWNICFDAGTAIGSFAIGAVAATGLGLAGAYVGCAMLIVLSSISHLVTPRG